MAKKRTTVFADEEDLVVLKAAAARLGVAEAELIRDAIHVAALANRTWDEPFFSRTYRPIHPGPSRPAEEVLADAWEAEVQAYRRTKELP